MQAKVAFDSVCAKVAEKYKDMGWKYAKSQHWMSKKDKNFTYKVLFYTSYYNRSDESVAFYGAFGIYSNKSKRCFTALSTEKCNIPEGRLEWNVAKEDTWDETVEEFTNWFDNMGLPMIEECTNNLDEYVKKVAKEGFYPWRGYVINIDFVLQFGSRELAEEAAKRYYDSLTERIKMSFKENYESMIRGGDAVNQYGSFQMLNPSNFRTIIENKLMIELEAVDRFTIDRIDDYYDEAFKAYCDLNSVSADKVTEEEKQEIYLYAGNHIGFFIAWVIKHDFISDEHKGNEGVNKVKEETMTGTEYLIEYCDTKFLSDDVAETLIPFIREYYWKSYFKDYCDWVINELCDLPMEFIGTWEDYHEFEHVIDKAYEEFCTIN